LIQKTKLLRVSHAKHIVPLDFERFDEDFGNGRQKARKVIAGRRKNGKRKTPQLRGTQANLGRVRLGRGDVVVNRQFLFEIQWQNKKKKTRHENMKKIHWPKKTKSILFSTLARAPERSKRLTPWRRRPPAAAAAA
jgi:hypothetical protein